MHVLNRSENSIAGFYLCVYNFISFFFFFSYNNIRLFINNLIPINQINLHTIHFRNFFRVQRETIENSCNE